MSSYNNSNLFSVKGKTCIVTGAGSGMATALAVNGAKVIICGRRIEQVETAAEEINKLARESGKGGEVIAFQADVGTKQGVVDFYDKCDKVIDKLDFLVNKLAIERKVDIVADDSAGTSANWKDHSAWDNTETLQAKLLSIDDSDWANMTAIHCAGPYYLAVKFIDKFQKSNDPSVCNITSLASFFLARAVCEFSYAKSKAAETQLTQMMAAALQPFKIRVNSVCPGLFPSGLTINAEGQFHAPMLEAHKVIPAGRAGIWEEIAGPVLLLASPAGTYMNAANIVIDGGWHLNASARDI